MSERRFFKHANAAGPREPRPESSGELRSKQIAIRVTPTEYAAFAEKSAGMGVSEWARTILLQSSGVTPRNITTNQLWIEQRAQRIIIGNIAVALGVPIERVREMVSQALEQAKQL